jgi:phenylalanyl-tRNA synthetase alpha chain
LNFDALNFKKDHPPGPCRTRSTPGEKEDEKLVLRTPHLPVQAALPSAELPVYVVSGRTFRTDVDATTPRCSTRSKASR